MNKTTNTVVRILLGISCLATAAARCMQGTHTHTHRGALRDAWTD